METFDKFLYIYDFIRPVLDISILTYLFYKIYMLLKGTNSVQILRSIVIVALAYGIALIFDLKTLLWLLNVLAPALVIAFAVIFQPEIRKLFLRIGQNQWFAFGKRSKDTYIDSVLTAADLLSKQKRGMLVVFTRNTKLENYITSGTKLNADLSSALLMTIFAMDTAMHDGAVFIDGKKVLAAGCFLPLSEQYDIKKTFGTRHRAALGLSEVCDAVVLVVSEETGALSLAYDAKLNYDLSLSEVRKTLESLLSINHNLDSSSETEEIIENSKQIS